MPGFPLAVAASVRSPGIGLLVNLLAAASSPGTAALRALLIASKPASHTAAGSIAADTQIYEGLAGSDDVKTLLSAGVPGHLAAKALFAEFPLAQVDLVAPAEPAGVAATQTLTLDDTTPVTVAQTLILEGAGRIFTYSWAPGVNKTTAGTAFAALINGLGDDVPFTAASVAGVITITFKLKGTIGNDVLLYVTLKDGTGGAATLGAAALAGGTLEPTLTSVLALVVGREYDIIIPCLSNTDVQTASATSGVGRIKTHIGGNNSGLAAKLQSVVVGATGSLSATKTGTAQHNFEYADYIFCNAGQSLPCEFAGAEAGAMLREETLDPAVNRIRLIYRAALYGARDVTANALTPAQVEDALQSGVCPVTYTFAKELRPERPCTTYFKDAAGNPDGRVFDRSKVAGTIAVAKDLRVALPQQYPGKKLSEDLAVGDDDPPEGVVEVSEIREFIMTRLAFFVKKGVVRKDLLDAAIADGTFIVRVNPSDPSQCDIVLPMGIVPPLAKFSLVVQKVA